MKKEVIIQFSGGIDSLYAAHYLAPQYDRVHLVTFNKGYLHFALKANQANIGLLKSLHGENKFIYSFIEIKELFKEMAVKTYKETKSQYGSEIAWCVPCRASMMLQSIIYALENEIPEFTDGANWEQAPDGERVLATADNYPEFLEVIKSFAREYRVSYLPVLYNFKTRRERRDELLGLGARIDFNSLDRKKKSIFDVFNKRFYKRYQPICLSGYLIHWKRNFFNVKEEMTAEMTVNSIKPKLETIGRKYISDYFKNKGLRLEETMAARR